MVKTYNAKEVTMAAGNHIVTGFADDSFITIETNGDGVTKKVGCDGEVARAISPDGTYKVKLTLLQTSDSNSFFQKQHNIDMSPGGDGTFPIMVKDMRGGLLAQADQAWVTKPATRVRGKESNNNEWEIQTGEATMEE